MGILTGGQVESDFYRLLQGSALAEEVSGGIYFETARPRDSRLEDIVVIFTAGETSQIQEGKVTLNIYVPDITPYANGQKVRDKQRIDYLSGLAMDWIGSIRPSETRYRIGTRSTVTYDRDGETGQHFIAVHLWYKYF